MSCNHGPEHKTACAACVGVVVNSVCELTEKLAAAGAKVQEQRGRILLAAEAVHCCNGCVTQWLLGDLDQAQRARALSAAKGK